MAITFPSSPTTNQVFSTANNTWIYDGTKWRVSRPINSTIQVGDGLTINAGNASVNDASFSNVSINEIVKVSSGGTGLTYSGAPGSILVSDGKKWISTDTLSTPLTFNSNLTLNSVFNLNGSSNTVAAILKNAAEPITIVGTAAGGTINFDLLTQSIIYYTNNAVSNWTINFRGSSVVQLKNILSKGQSITVVFMATQGSTAYYNNTVQIDGVSVTPKWLLGAPTGGNINSIDIYTYTIIETDVDQFIVLASQAQYT